MTVTSTDDESTAGQAAEGPERRCRIAVIGSGFAGLTAGYQLLRAGIDDFLILERGPEVGGTWRDNTYPGAACDVPSLLYSFSFHQNPEWTRAFSPQAEIWDYLRRAADEFGLRPHLCLDTEVRASTWDDDASEWVLRTSRGTVRANVVLAGGGPLADPVIPDLPGLEEFAGEVFHSSRWNHDLDLAGKRVAVVGTGASAIQFVPQIQPEVAHLDLYQRTPPWIMPRHDRALTALEHAVYRKLPAVQHAARLGMFWGREFFWLNFNGHHPRINAIAQRQTQRHLAKQVPDRALRARLTPDFRLGCKRVLLSDDYYPALGQPNVDLVDTGVQRVTKRGLVDADGVEREADVIIFGTGFRATDLPMAHYTRGRGGLLLAEAWRDGMTAYQAAATAGFPNLFFVIGPNSGLGHSSMTLIIEAQVRYAVGAIRAMAEHGVADVEVRPEAEREYNERLQRRMSRTVWMTGGCTSWYLDRRTGRNTTLWPDFVWRFQLMNRSFDPRGYRLRSWGAVPARRA